MRVEVTVDWAESPKRKRAEAEPELSSIPRSRAESRLYFIALGQHIEEAVQRGEFASLAEVARACGVSRARISQCCPAEVGEL